MTKRQRFTSKLRIWLPRGLLRMDFVKDASCYGPGGGLSYSEGFACTRAARCRRPTGYLQERVPLLRTDRRMRCVCKLWLRTAPPTRLCVFGIVMFASSQVGKVGVQMCVLHMALFPWQSTCNPAVVIFVQLELERAKSIPCVTPFQFVRTEQC